MIKIVTVVGARPQFIKAAIVSKTFKQTPNVNEIMIHTGQHYDDNMSQIFLDELEITNIHHHLGINATTHGKQTGEMLIAIETILLAEKPDWLLIYGDTNSTLAGALAAAKLHIPIAHVEAGLRSYNRKMPEEINRLVADQLSEVLFTPTEEAINNLTREGYPASRIFLVGDVMYDAALFYGNKATHSSTILKTLGHQAKRYILTTIHRAENTNDKNRLLTIFAALEKIGETLAVVMPLHPRTRKFIENYHPNLLKQSKINFINPVGFLDMIMLEKHAALIITDSGGVQKEAFFYQVPCITLRDETEWVETVTLNWNRVVKPVSQEDICDNVFQALGKTGENGYYPYGDGNAAKLIANHLER